MLTACFSVMVQLLLLLIRIAMKLRLSISAGVPGVDAHSVSTVVSCARDTGGWNTSGDAGLRDAVMDHLPRSICKARAGLMPALFFCAARWADAAFAWRRPARGAVGLQNRTRRHDAPHAAEQTAAPMCVI